MRIAVRVDVALAAIQADGPFQQADLAGGLEIAGLAGQDAGIAGFPL